MSERCTECGQPYTQQAVGGSLRPGPILCDWCRKIAVHGKTGVGAQTFKAPDDIVVKAVSEGNTTELIVRAEPNAGRAERTVFMAFIGIAALLLVGMVFQPGIILPILAVSVMVLLTGLSLSRVAGARSTFSVDGANFRAKGWRGGSVQTSPRDVREIRIDGKGPSVEHNRPRTSFDIAIALDDGTTQTLKTQFRRHEYAEETVARVRAAIDRAAQR